MKKQTLEEQIKASGEMFFNQKTSHLTFHRRLEKSTFSWNRLLTWGTPTFALGLTVTVMVSILIGATRPNGSLPQDFTGLQALNEVSFPSYKQREESEDFEFGRPEYTDYRIALEDYFQLTATDLFSTSDNIVYSPLSAYVAMSLLLEAAGGETELAIEELLGVHDRLALREASNQVFIDTYYQDEISVNGNTITRAQSQMGNGVFVRDDITVNEDYLFRLAGDYFAEVFHTAFDDAGKEAIAGWLNQRTNQFLSMQPSDLTMNQETVLSLFNTLYLKANWLTAFTPIAQRGTFTNSSNHTTVNDVTYMLKETQETLYLDQPNFTLGVDEAYGDYRVVYVLPKGSLTPIDLLNETHFPLIRSALTQTNQNERIRLTIPKSSTTVELDLKENLLNVAPQIAPLFSPDQADLSNALPGAYVQNLIQHVRIDFLEDGMEAAAITSADIGVTSAPTPAKVSLTLDRSYLYFVLNGQGLILFSGVMNQPSI